MATLENLATLEKLEKVEKELKKEKLEKVEKEKLEKEKENLVKTLNTLLEKTGVEKGLFWYEYSDSNKTLHFNKKAIENLNNKGFKLPDNIVKNKYINYIKNTSCFNMVEKLFTIYSDSFTVKEKLEKEKEN